MTLQRSLGDPDAGQQLYAIVESCRTPQTLWDKLATGNYDWIGVRRTSGRFVLGRPRLSAVREHGETEDSADDPAPHHVEIRGPLDRHPHHEPYPSVGEAREAYERVIAGDPITPLRSTGVWRVRLILDGQTVEERLVVRTLPRVV
ncbi:MAG: hypothetical protein QOG20_1944 [Pseudonocardiales bacterium]|nr:hypothetical protein [Pseudonocardiales bacterium]